MTIFISPNVYTGENAIFSLKISQNTVRTSFGHRKAIFANYNQFEFHVPWRKMEYSPSRQKQWVESLPNQIEPCATNAKCQRVHWSGRVGDIAVDM